MSGDRKYLASYMVDAWRRRRNEDLQANIHRDPICESPEITIEFGHASSRFMFGKTSFNTPEADALVSDKSTFFDATYEHMMCPMTHAYEKRDGRSNEEIRDEILKGIESQGHFFSFPIVLKPSEGSLSRNVFIAEDEGQLMHAIQTIRGEYDQGDKMLVQQYLGDENGIFREIRGICLDGECMLAYERVTDQDIPRDVLTNPSAWPGAKRQEVNDPDITAQIEKLAEHLYYQHGVSYVAFDMKCDRHGRMWLMEGNIAPMGLDDLERDLPNGRAFIEKLTNRMIDKIKFQGTAEPADLSAEDLQPPDNNGDYDGMDHERLGHG